MMGIILLNTREDYIDDNLGAFSFALLQDLRTLLTHLSKIGVGEDEFKEFVLNKINKSKNRPMSKSERERADRNKPRCPKCNSVLSIKNVNTQPCNQVGGKYKTQIFCPDVRACGFQKFRE